MTTPVHLEKQDVLCKVVSILEGMTRDWDLEYSGSISGQTRLMADLQCESIDIVMLIVAIEERFQRKGLPFENLLMFDGRYVDDLTVEQIADFLMDALLTSA